MQMLEQKVLLLALPGDLVLQEACLAEGSHHLAQWELVALVDMIP
jgi:hypothetical protein